MSLSYISSTGDVFVLRDSTQQNVVDSLILMTSFSVDSVSGVDAPVQGKLYLGRRSGLDISLVKIGLAWVS